MTDESLRTLVRAAQILAAVAGTPEAAATMAASIASTGTAAIPAIDDDLHLSLRDELERRGVLRTTGTVNPARAAELVAVTHIVAAVTQSTQAPAPPAKLVFSAPPASMTLHPAERLDLYIINIIRQATDRVVLGGPFWNESGLEQIGEVLQPALQFRDVAVQLYLHPPARDDITELLTTYIAELRTLGKVTVQWFKPNGYTMLHAKFAVGDDRRGYLGSANLTSWGMNSHVEVGAALEPAQCQQLLDFLERLKASHAFTEEAST